MQRVYLSRKNLLTLLSKLDRLKNGELTLCTIVKSDIGHPKYPCSDEIIITAIEDEEYYINREPGQMHPKDNKHD